MQNPSMSHTPCTWQYLVGFEVLTAVMMKSSIFWDITLYSSLKISWHFGGTYHLHLQACYLLHAGFLLGLFFSPQDEGNMFHWNSSWLSADNMTLYSRRKLLVGLGTYGAPMIGTVSGFRTEITCAECVTTIHCVAHKLQLLWSHWKESHIWRKLATV
jgi:hypothetical protein